MTAHQIRRHSGSDDGFTVVEIVVAAAILFFVLTAILGLVASSTTMSLTAKQETAMVNAVSSHMEWVRSLSFDELAISGVDPGGVVDAERILTIEGYTVTIHTEVTDGRAGTKEVRVTAVCEAPGRNPLTMTSFAAVWDTETGLVQEFDPDAPIVEFGIQTPAADEIVYGANRYLGGSALIIDATASSPASGGVITNLSFYCLGQLLRNGNSIFADVAAWNTSSVEVSRAFMWDTRQVDDEGNPGAIEDGWRTVTVVASDNESREFMIYRRLYVDNNAPDVPLAPVPEVYDDVETRIAWPTAMDGSDPAQKYEVHLSQIVSEDGTLLDLGTGIVNEAVYLHDGSPFSRYVVEVRAGSPRNLYSAFSEMESPYVTRPTASGSSSTVYLGRTVNRTAYTHVSLSTIEPNFPCADVTYDVFRSMDPNNMGTTPYMVNVGGPSFEETVVKLVRMFGVPDPWYYQFRVNYTPLGYGGGTPESSLSDVVGPITASTTTELMVHAVW